MPDNQNTRTNTTAETVAIGGHSLNAETKKDPEPKLIDTKAAHRRYGMSTGWFEQQRWKGNGPPWLKIGARALYNVEVVDAWFAARQIG